MIRWICILKKMSLMVYKYRIIIKFIKFCVIFYLLIGEINLKIVILCINILFIFIIIIFIVLFELKI